jgi:hypothetical protein
MQNEFQNKFQMRIVKKVLAIFEVEGKRGANLESCCENLNSIPLRTMEPECVFSGCGRTLTKIRSSVHDDSMYNLFERIFQDKK